MNEYEEDLIVDMHDNPMYWAEKYLELEAKNKRLHKALKLASETVAEEVQHLIHTYGDCSLTRCAKAELAEIDKALEGQGGEE